MTLYSRRNCHLCDAALAAIRSVDHPEPFDLEVVDIDEDALLRERYTNDVPVVAIDGAETFWHHVDPAELRRALARRDDP